jgi:hypothetical protein
MKRILFVAPFLTILFLIGCTRGQNSSTAQPGTPSASTPKTMTVTAIATVPIAIATPSVEATATATATSSPIPMTIDPTYFIFPTVTPTATLDPSLILLRIVSPGPLSKVVSPIELIVHIAPDYTGTTRIELIGEDGVQLYRKVFKTYSNIGYYTRVDEKIQYEINGAAEVGRLQISTLDGKGRLQAFNSVRLLLQGVGENVFNPPYTVEDRTVLRSPARDEEISGGSLAVTGEFKPANDLPIVLELIDDEGNVLGSRILQLGPADNTYQRFSTDIPYQVTKKTPVLLVIRQGDDRIDGLAYLYSLQLLIRP